MSGLYNMVFGSGSAGRVLVDALGLSEIVGRYRDAWIEMGDDVRIAVYTRNGGGNREDYENEIEAMQAHPLYLHDADDEFDSTYATFYFRLPEDLSERMDAADPTWRGQVQPAVDTSAKWLDAIAAIKGSES